MALPKLEVPTYELTLPTTKKKVKFRPFLVGEQKTLLMATEAGEESVLLAIRQIVDACTFQKLDVDTMPNADLEYIFLQIRIRSVGENIELVLTCQHCGEQHDHALNLTEVQMQIDPKHTNKFMLTDSVGIEMAYPTTEQMNELNRNYTTETIYKTILNCMVHVFDEEQVYPTKDEPEAEVMAWLEGLTDEQFDKIKHFFASMPVLRHTFTGTCPTCEKESEYTLEGIESFFA